MAQMTLERVGQPALPELDRHRRGSWRIVREVTLLAVLFGVYNLGRFLSAGHAGAAVKHAGGRPRSEAWLGLRSEAVVQHHALEVHVWARVADLYYAGVHCPLSAILLLWL